MAAGAFGGGGSEANWGLTHAAFWGLHEPVPCSHLLLTLLLPNNMHAPSRCLSPHTRTRFPALSPSIRFPLYRASHASPLSSRPFLLLFHFRNTAVRSRPTPSHPRYVRGEDIYIPLLSQQRSAWRPPSSAAARPRESANWGTVHAIAAKAKRSHTFGFSLLAVAIPVTLPTRHALHAVLVTHNDRA